MQRPETQASVDAQALLGSHIRTEGRHPASIRAKARARTSAVFLESFMEGFDSIPSLSKFEYPSADMSLLRVSDLSISFETDNGFMRAVDSVSFELGAGEALGIVGESGCGKSVTALSLLRLIPSPPGRFDGGTIELEGRDLLKLPEREMRSIRGKQIAMIFQEPMTSLNPVYAVGSQIVEAIRLHAAAHMTRDSARDRAIELLGRVGIPAPETSFDAFPHELSGGMRQRIMIAMALACAPKVLIADEPTTALDVTIQAQIMDLLVRLQRELEMAMIFITHDLSLIAEHAQRVAVMYAGQIVEQGPVTEVFSNPQHPYTRGLLGSLPSRTARGARGVRARLPVIPGMVPDLSTFDGQPGCRFAARCDVTLGRCAVESPAIELNAKGNLVRCFNPGALP
jgi:peptide/nickel transport system ATP-binding protein